MTDIPNMGESMETGDLNFGQTLVCVFGIQSHKSRTHLAPLGSPGSTVAELMEVLNHDRSNVNHPSTTLLDKGLTGHERCLLDPDGYVYQYMTTPLPEAKKMMHAMFDEQVEDIHARIDTLGESQARDRLHPR